MGAEVIHDEDNFVFCMFTYVIQEVLTKILTGFCIRPCLPLAIIDNIGYVYMYSSNKYSEKGIYTPTQN